MTVNQVSQSQFAAIKRDEQSAEQSRQARYKIMTALLSEAGFCHAPIKSQQHTVHVYCMVCVCRNVR